MDVKLHDGYGHVADTVMSATTAHGHAHQDPLMRHIAGRSGERGEHGALLDALLGKDIKATVIARATAATAIGSHDAGVLALLADTCGGVDAHVAVALSPWLDDEASIEGGDGSGLAWRDGRLIVQPASCDGLILSSAGTITAHLGTPLPQTVLTALAGRTVGDLLDLPQAPAVAARRIATATDDDGETVLKLAA